MKKLVLFMVFFPFIVLANYTGEKILKAAQKYGMTDSELNYLIDNTAPDLTLKDPRLRATALIHAAINNRPNMVRILLGTGQVDVNEFDVNGETALIGATKKGNTEVVKILLEFGADQSIVGNNNKSAYDYAVQSQNSELARLLGGAPKTKTSFRSLSDKMSLATNRKKTSPDLMSQKYVEDLGKISLIVDSMKPGSAKSSTGKSDVAKINEIGKITGFSEVVDQQMKTREQEEQKSRLEKEKKKKEEHSKMMAKLKAISAFNNLYLDVSNKGKATTGGNWAQKGAAGGKSSDVSKMSFSDATNALMSDLEQKTKMKEEEINRQKELDMEKGAQERARAINLIIFSGSKGNNVDALKNEPPEKLKAKLESIKSLVDPKESPEVRKASLDMAAKKIAILKKMEPSPKAYPSKIDFLKLEETYLRKKAEADAKKKEEIKMAELEKQENMEKDKFYKVVQEKAKVSKVTENMKKQSMGTKGVSIDGDKSKDGQQFGGKPGFDEVNAVLMTPDFHLWPLTNRDCEIRRSPDGGFQVFIKKLKLTNVKQTSRKEAIWFVNMKEKPTPPSGGLSCNHITCKDPALYVDRASKTRDLFLSNLFIKQGATVKDHFEIYSSVPGNTVVKVPVTECRKTFY